MTQSREHVPVPRVSIVMAAFNVAPYLDEALRSVRRQTLADFEAIVVDDGSSDDTADIARRHALEDPRVRCVAGPGRGPAAARNLAIAQARGRWIAVVDADDHIDPVRLETLADYAERQDCDAVADNMAAFYEDDRSRDHRWIPEALWPAPRILTFRDLMLGGLGRPPAPELGYLKPMLKRDRLAELGEAYREHLLIGEDFDLMARWTAAGFSYHYVPQALYAYRRRTTSLSYRLTAVQVRQMLGALDTLEPAASAADRPALAARRKALVDVGRYVELVERLKRRDAKALVQALGRADSRRRLARSVVEGLARRVRRRRA